MAVYAPHEYPDELRNLTEGDEADLTKNKDGGIVKKLVTAGQGTEYPCIGDSVTISYVGYLGEIAPEYVFDSTEKNGKNYVFEIGKGAVIRGMECAIYTMKRGERAEITIQPIHAWGRAGSPPKVPRDTPVVFDINLIDFAGDDMSEDRDGSIIRNVLQGGTGHSQPNKGALVELHIKGFHGDRVFDDRDVTFPFGEGTSEEYKVPVFIENLLRELRLGEKSRLKMKHQACYGDEGCLEYDIPAKADLTYEVHLKTFERTKEIWEMNSKEKMDQCDMQKEKGTMYFKKQNYVMAEQFYRNIVENLEHDTCMESPEEDRRQALLIVGNINVAFVCLRQEKWAEATKRCNAALKLDPKNEKALYRRAEAAYNTKEYVQAKQDYVRVLEVNPQNKLAKDKVNQCDVHIKKMAASEKQLCQKMLSISPNTPEESLLYQRGNVFDDLGDWSNDMASGMMTLEQECEAFGEFPTVLPQKTNNNHGIGH